MQVKPLPQERRVGIVGSNGFVGKAMNKLFPDAVVYSPSLEGSRIEDLNDCDAVFVCVPTDLNDDGSLDVSIVEDVVKKSDARLFIIRSTLNPGTADRLEKEYGKNIVVNPEYVGESVAHPLVDEKERNFLVLGGSQENRRKAIEIYHLAYNSNLTIRQVTNLEAEVIKLCENRAIAFKVMQCHELFEACEKAGVDYYVIREAVYGDDPRFNLWWTFAYPGRLGFNNSGCLRKDVPAWCAWAESVGIKPDITKLLVTKSREYESLRNNSVQE